MTRKTLNWTGHSACITTPRHPDRSRAQEPSATGECDEAVPDAFACPWARIGDDTGGCTSVAGETRARDRGGGRGQHDRYHSAHCIRAAVDATRTAHHR